MKFHRRQFEIRVNDGNETRTGLVSHCGLFAIDKRGEGKTAVYALTHVPTGLAIQYVDTLKLARHIATKIEHLTDWNTTDGAAIGQVPHLGLRVRNLAMGVHIDSGIENGSPNPADFIVPAQWHESLTPERILGIAQESMADSEMIGACTHCGAEAYGVEPDAREYHCEECGHSAVYGGEELLILTAA